MAQNDIPYNLGSFTEVLELNIQWAYKFHVYLFECFILCNLIIFELQFFQVNWKQLIF